MNRPLQFPPVVVPAKCFARGCDNPAADGGLRMLCSRCAEEMSLNQDRVERARETVWANETAVMRKRRDSLARRRRQVLMTRAWRATLLLILAWFCIAYVAGKL